jgi:hypothetical protein
MTDKDLYIKQIEAENEKLREKNESLVKLIDDVTSNKAIRAEEVINLDVATCSWLVPRLKMFLEKMHVDDKNDKKLVNDLKAMIDGFSVVIQPKTKEHPDVYPVMNAADTKMYLKALKVFGKRLSRLWM